MDYQAASQTNLQPGSDGIRKFVVNGGNNKNEQQIRKFLKLLYGQQGTEGYLVLFSKEGSRPYFFSRQELDDAV